MELSEQDDLVAIRRCVKKRQAKHYAWVLMALGMPSLVALDGTSWTLYVPREAAQRAEEELSAYDSENRGRRPAGRQLLALAPSEVELAYCAVLLFFFAASIHQTWSFDWTGKGAAQAGLMLHGEWWRAVTALCLHGSADHLIGNLVFGWLFILLLGHITGTGLAGLSMLICGAAGNALNALVQAPAHTSIGASTAVFAGLGTLTALQQLWPRERRRLSMRSLAPLAGGVTLLLFLGFSGENTDILGHVLGFCSGIAAGWWLSRRNRDWAADRWLQWKCNSATVAILAASWGLAVIT